MAPLASVELCQVMIYSLVSFHLGFEYFQKTHQSVNVLFTSTNKGINIFLKIKISE